MKSIGTYSNKVSLEARWKVFFEALGQAVSASHTNQINHVNHVNQSIPILWLANAKVFVAVKDHTQKADYPTSKDELLRFQERADQTDFPVLCIKGLPESNRYSIRLFAPRSRPNFPKFYWATFAIGEGNRLCLIEGEKFMYLQAENQTKLSAVIKVSKIPDRHSLLIEKAINNARCR